MSGVVRDTAAVVIEGASVSVGSATATTGADGRFELQNLPVGSATIITSAPDFNRRSESVGLIAGLNTHDVVLTPAPTATATVSGTVSAATAAVIEGASVSIGSATVTTGVDGRYVLQNLPVGSATIITSAPRFGQRVESVSLNKGPNTHDVVLTPAPTIVSGIVSAATGAVIEGASVSIGSATATTGADGRYELRNLPVGSATIITSAPGFDRRSELVRLLAGPNTHDVVLTPTPRATVSG
ncbi:MAG TPA: carboxypeptidase regulatory-like domain-containing protein, partial [Myxococcaceae bacterium]